MSFKIGDKVRRNPRIFMNVINKGVGEIVRKQGSYYYVQFPQKERNEFTGKLELPRPIAYLAQELIPA